MERKEAQAPLSPAARPRATILRPRTSAEGVFSGGRYSPGPMTLLSTFFGDGDECKSFSELLAGARVDPTTPFTLPHGFSPSTFLDSPSQGQFGMTHQHMLAQITSQAVPPPSNVQIQAQHPFPISAVSATSLTQVPTGSSTAQKLISLTVPDSKMTAASFDYSHSEQKLQSSSSVHVDKPNDDGYNWRKYGQKHVKGSDFSRSYYKCTHPKCPVKKKLERSLDGHVTAIIYKGDHSHQPPNPSKLTKDTTTSNENSDSLKEGMGCSQATGEHGSGTSDSEEVGDHEIEADEKNDEPDAKRRNTEASQDPASLHRTAAEPRIIVQTTSEVDLLDDGYRWRKYGQKVVKGNPYPRSYYKCTTTDCNVRKHVERASTDPKAVITTYEGKHNHDVPAAKTNSHTLANNNASQAKAQNAIPNSVTGNEHRPVASLRLKDEQLT